MIYSDGMTTTITLTDEQADRLNRFLSDLASGGPGYIPRHGVDEAAALRDIVVDNGVRIGR